MAPPPEYVKEPKAPDKSATNISSEESKTLHNIVNDQQTNSDSKPGNTAANVEVENNKHVEHLDDGQLKALLDEAITYKCPKDREGKSSLFNELLEEVEQDEQALEAAARELSGGRAARRARGGAGRRALPHSNSLQNLEQEALAAESALRRVRHAPHHHAPNVSARAIHGGSLPSDVDKSFLLGEEPSTARAGYLATVRCVNPPPLAERRVSASDANCPAEMELLNRRSKPPFPMTYTARATLEIGSSSVSSGRAVTTTTASNQVRTPPPPRLRTHPSRLARHKKQHPHLRFVVPDVASFGTQPTSGPPERLYAKTKRLYNPKDGNIVFKSKQFHNQDASNKTKNTNNQYIKMKDTLRPQPEVHKITQSNELSVENEDKTDPIQLKLLSALLPRKFCDVDSNNGGGYKQTNIKESEFSVGDTCKGRRNVPRGPEELTEDMCKKNHSSQETTANLISSKEELIQQNQSANSQSWLKQVNSWYEGLGTYSNECKSPENAFYQALHSMNNDSRVSYYGQTADFQNRNYCETSSKNISPNIYQNIASGICSSDYTNTATSSVKSVHYMKPISMTNKMAKNETLNKEFDDESNQRNIRNVRWLIDNICRGNSHTNTEELSFSRTEYRNRVGKSLRAPSLSSINPRNIRSMSIGKPTLDMKDNSSIQCAYTLVNEHIADKTNQDNEYVHKTGDIDTIDKYISTESVNLRSHINNEFLCFNNQLDRDNITIIGHFETDRLSHSISSSMPVLAEGNRAQETEFIDMQHNLISSTNDKEMYILGQSEHGVKGVPINSQKEMELGLITTSKSQEENNKDIELEPLISHTQEKQSSLELKEGIELRDMNSDIRQENSFPQYLADQTKLFQALKAINETDSVQDRFYVSSLDKNAEKVNKTSEVIEQIQCSHNNLGFRNQLLYAFKANYIEDSVQDNFSISNNLDINSEKVQMNNKITKQVDCCSKFIEEECIRTPNIPIESDFSDNRNPISATTSEYSDKVVVRNNTVGKKTEFVTSDENPTDAALKGLVVVQKKTINEQTVSVNSDENATDTTPECLSKSIRKKTKSTQSDKKSSDATVQGLNELTCNYGPDGASIEALSKTVDNIMEPLVSDKNSIVATANDCQELVVRNKTVHENEPVAQCDLQEFPDNAFVSLTFLKRLPASSVDETDNSIDIENATKPMKKIEKVPNSSGIKKYMINKDALRTLLLQNLFKSDDSDQSVKLGEPAITDNEVDSAIPFNCITSSEIVDSCNTTPSTTQSAVAEDTKPLQLGSSYRAVASLTGDTRPPPLPLPPEARAGAGPVLAPTPVLPLVRAATARLEQQQSRSVISSSFNGLPLARTSYGSTASSAPDDFKKSLDENGNSLQGFSSPLSGSSQHKKPRRKKSSKNETVITSHQIDGYQGNKDLNEVLRFIESNAEHGRGAKLGRAKHKDDSEDKSGKKRSTERRKDKETKMKRATSMEELSRTKLEDLTDKPGGKARWPEGGAPGKAERRSWGDDSRGAYYYRDEPEPADADFQTVTKKRKPRRRADEGEREPGAGDPPRAARAPSPRARRVSAPPSDRSNDSNDDLDSVHSLPADAPPARHAPQPPAAAPVSYADIARTRHNIPDLIESCNFYADGEVGPPARPRPGPRPQARRAARAPATRPQGTRDRGGAGAGVPRAGRGGGPAAARHPAGLGGAPARNGRHHLRVRHQRAAPQRSCAAAALRSRPRRGGGRRGERGDGARGGRRRWRRGGGGGGRRGGARGGLRCAAVRAARAAARHAAPAADSGLRRRSLGGRGPLRRRQGAVLQRVARGERPRARTVCASVHVTCYT